MAFLKADIIHIQKEERKKMDNIKRLLRSDNYLTINRDLAKHVGINAAILYQVLLINHEEEGSSFFLSSKTIEKRTTLKRRQQETAIKKLIRSKLITVCFSGMPAKRMFNVLENQQIDKVIENAQLKISPDAHFVQSRMHILYNQHNLLYNIYIYNNYVVYISKFICLNNLSKDYAIYKLRYNKHKLSKVTPNIKKRVRGGYGGRKKNIKQPKAKQHALKLAELKPVLGPPKKIVYHGVAQCVALAAAEYERLVYDFGKKKVLEIAEKIGNYNKKSYKNYNIAIRNWLAKEGVKSQTYIDNSLEQQNSINKLKSQEEKTLFTPTREKKTLGDMFSENMRKT